MIGYDVVKDKLHEYIEHADETKVMAMFTLFCNETVAPRYSEETLKSLEETRDKMISGKEKTYTMEEAIANLHAHRNRHGV